MDVDNEVSGDTTDIKVKDSAGVLQRIAALYTKRNLCDVTLVVNGIEFPAHRLILCAASDVFTVMLMNPSWNEATETRVILTESVESAQVFEQFLKYLYTGEINLTITTVIYLLQLADKYNVEDLNVLCLDYMRFHIPAAASKNQLIQWYQYSTIFGDLYTVKLFQNFIKWNFDMIARADDFPLLDQEHMCQILAADDIVVTDEYTLYCYIDFWIECQKGNFPDTLEGKDNLTNLVEYTLSLIRFPMMKPRQLADLLLIPLTQNFKEHVMNHMSISMTFHAGGSTEKLRKLLEFHPFPSKLFTPRMYWTSDWGVCMTIDSFSNFNHYQAKTLVFSTPLSFCERLCDKQLEWVLDFYPKGVCFKKCFLIVWEGTRECPEHVLRTVRLAIHCKNEGVEPVRVQISILVTGQADGVEYTQIVLKQRAIFSSHDKILNIDNILPYEDLVPSATQRMRAGTNVQPSGEWDPEAECISSFKHKRCFLTGPTNDMLKVRILITPVPDFNFEKSLNTPV